MSSSEKTEKTILYMIGFCLAAKELPSLLAKGKPEMQWMHLEYYDSLRLDYFKAPFEVQRLYRGRAWNPTLEIRWRRWQESEGKDVFMVTLLCEEKKEMKAWKKIFKKPAQDKNADSWEECELENYESETSDVYLWGETLEKEKDSKYIVFSQSSRIRKKFRYPKEFVVQAKTHPTIRIKTYVQDGHAVAFRFCGPDLGKKKMFLGLMRTFISPFRDSDLGNERSKK